MNSENEREIAYSLVESISAGNRSAENTMVQRYHRGLILVLMRKSNMHIAEDVAQETWRIVIEKVRAGRLRDPGSLAAFITQTGRNQLIMYFRRQNTSDGSDIEADESNHTNEPCDRVEQQQIGDAVRQLLAELPTERDRDILKRYYLHEEDKDNICKSLDLSELHFNRVLYRAKQRFRHILDKAKLSPKQ